MKGARQPVFPMGFIGMYLGLLYSQLSSRFFSQYKIFWINSTGNFAHFILYKEGF